MCWQVIHRTKRKVAFSDLMRRDGEVFKYMSFRDVLAKEPTFAEPYCIVSTEL